MVLVSSSHIAVPVSLPGLAASGSEINRKSTDTCGDPLLGTPICDVEMIWFVGPCVAACVNGCFEPSNALVCVSATPSRHELMNWQGQAGLKGCD